MSSNDGNFRLPQGEEPGVGSSTDNIAIRVCNLSKCYQIYDTPRDRLKQFVAPRLQRLTRQSPKQYFREFWALKDVSFEVKKGETVGVIGRNGSGKSTLLQIICGTLTPTSGSVETRGRVAALLELGSGFNPNFTGRENVYMNAAVLGLSREETDERFDDIAALADIGQFIEQPIKTYSSGMMVRLAFSVQAAIDPAILIVDEALAVGDEKFQRKCFARLEDLKNRGTSVLFVSHAGPQVIELCDRAILLDGGEQLMCGNPATMIRSYQKLIYAPPDSQTALRQKMASSKENQASSTQDAVAKPAASLSADLQPDSRFDEHLKPDTTSSYPELGARIDAFEIHEMNGHRVNILSSEEVYRFSVIGHSWMDLQEIYFGIHIRSVTGTVITGQRFPREGESLHRINANSNFRVSFEFRMILLPGVYFIGGGMWSHRDPNCVHRILDATMFRIVSHEAAQSFGIVDAAVGHPHYEVF